MILGSAAARGSLILEWVMAGLVPATLITKQGRASLWESPGGKGYRVELA
jgi:hypothetical protein